MPSSSPLAALIAELFAPREPASWSSLGAFVAMLDARAPDASPLETAVRGGAAADRLGYAFVAGYRAALTVLVPDVGARACLAATEKDGAHPRAIRTTLVERDGQLTLDGEKTFTTLATFADTLLVVARTGDRDGRPLLRVVRVPTSRAGVRITERAPTPFAPEVPHARVTFERVHVAPDEVLPGDGYADFLKPFRTVEDTHVLAATVGYLISIGDRIASVTPRDHSEPQSSRTLFVSALATALAALLEIARGDPRDAGVHVALAGIAPLVQEGLRSLEPAWLAADPEGHARFVRDRPLLQVADGARGERLSAALRALGSP